VKFFFREIFVFAKVFANKLVFSKLIKIFRGNSKTKIFVLTLPSNGAAWHDTAPQCWLLQCWLPECRTGAAWHAELEPHDNWRLKNWSRMTRCGSAMLSAAMLTTAILTTAMLTTAMLITAMLTTAILTTAMLTIAVLTTAALTTAMMTTGVPDCPASSQSGTGLRKTNDAGTDTELE
jgi:hypothetical protein